MMVSQIGRPSSTIVKVTRKMAMVRTNTAIPRPQEHSALLREEEGNLEVFEKLGKLFLEGGIIPGRNYDEIRALEHNMGATLSLLECSFHYGENILKKQGVESVLQMLQMKGTDEIEELRIVEHKGMDLGTINSFCLSEWNLQVHLYVLYDQEETLDSAESEKADITYLPNTRFDRQWERLTYEGDWKDIMMNMATNLVLPTRVQQTRDKCPMILLHGPAGTGKTTFAQSLAQKLSIRLSSHFLVTKLFEIRTGMLFSTKFGESARFVDEVFVKVRKASREDEKALIIVLIDEVESIAGSRQTAAEQKEAQDGPKATNTLLRNLDTLQYCRNVLLICTTNHPAQLDSSFSDRCICRKQIKLPKRRAQYEILRNRIQELIDQGQICPKITFPELAETKQIYRAKEMDHPAFRLYSLLEKIRAVNVNAQTGLSGRYLAGLPSNALDMFKQEETTGLNAAFDFMMQYATLEYGAATESEDEDSDSEEEDGQDETVDGDMQMDKSPTGESYQRPEREGKKRNHSLIVVEGSPEEIGESIRVLKKRGIDVVMRIADTNPK